MSTVQMTLRRIAEELKIPKSTLSYYASPELRLLKPVTEIPESKLYLYDINEVKQVLAKIKNLRKRGYELKDVSDKI